MRWAVMLLMCLAAVAGAYGDPTNLEDGVFIAHHPPDVQFSAGTDWCQKYAEEFAIDSCGAQHNRIDLDGNLGESSIWYVLAAWTEAKEWCGSEFGFGEYDPDIYGFLAWGPCSPGENLEIPTDNWPGPSEGTALTTTDAPWSGDIVSVYYFAGYAYYEGIIPLAADPSTGFGGTGNCMTPAQSWDATSFGGMGMFTDGIYVCPAEGGGGDDGGSEGDETAACCAGEDCRVVTADECERMGGEWFSERTSCDPNPCIESPDGREWRAIKLIYR